MQINKQALPVGHTYALWDFAPAPNGYKFTHDEFTVTTHPFDHALCGDVHYNVLFDGSPVTATSQPMSYDTLSRTFEIYSEDFNLVGLRDIEV